MTFSKNRSPYVLKYYPNDLELNRVYQNNDSGVPHDASLSFDSHCTRVQSKKRLLR